MADYTKDNLKVGYVSQAAAFDSGAILTANQMDKIDAGILEAASAEEVAKVLTEHKNQIENLNTTLNAEGVGLVDKIGDETTGLTKQVKDLEGTVGNEESGLVKNVADLQTNKADSLYYNAEEEKLYLKSGEQTLGNGIEIATDLSNYPTTKEMNDAIEEAINGVDVSEQLEKMVHKNELPDDSGYFIYQYDDNGVTRLQTRTSTIVQSTKPNDNDAVENVDYYIGNNGKYIHYRKILGTLIPVGSTDSGKYYRATFGREEIEGTPTNNVYSLYEVDSEPEDIDLNAPPSGGKLVSQFVLSSDKKQSTISLQATTPQELAFTKADRDTDETLQSFNIGFTYASLDSDETYCGGKYELFYNDNLIETGVLEAKREEKSIDVSSRITEGATHRFKLKVTDDIGTIKVLYWTYNYIRFVLEETFNASDIYGVNTIIPYTVKVSGAGFTKTVTLTYNGKTYTEQVIESEKNLTFNLPSAPHGRYIVECNATAQVTSNNKPKNISANEIRQDIIRIDGSLPNDDKAPIIASGWRREGQNDVYTIPVQQHSSINVPFYIYNKNNTSASLKKVVYINGEKTQEDISTVATGNNTWPVKVSQSGEYLLSLIINNGTGPNENLIISLTVEAVTIHALQKLASVEGYKILDFNPAARTTFQAGANGIKRLKVGSNLFGYAGAPGEFFIGSNKYDTRNYDIYIEADADFDWITSGYRTDAEGDSYFLLKAGSYLKVKYNPFYRTYDVSTNTYRAQSIDETGLTMQFLYAVKNASTQDEFLTCYKKEKGGIIMQPHQTIIQSGDQVLSLPLSEEDVIDFGFTVSPKLGNSLGISPKAIARNGTQIEMIMGYEDGVSTKPIIGSSTATNISLNPDDVEGIVIGSDHCDIHLYRLKFYSRELSDEDMLNSFIVNSKNGADMIARDTRNNFADYSTIAYDPTQETEYKAALTKISKDNPGVSVILIQAPRLTQGKDKKLESHKITNSTIYHWYTPEPLNNPTKEEYKEWEERWKDFNCNWVASGSKCYHIGQGTSSSRYGAAGFNIDIDLRDDDVSIKSLDNTEQTIGAIQLSPESQAQRYFNIKMNIASSENANNALLQQRYEEGNPFIRPIIRFNEDGERDEELESKISSTMEFHNCILFIQTTDYNYEQAEHRDNKIHFYGIGNIGNGKKTDESRLSRIGDPFEFIVEIQDYNRPLSEFPLLKETTVDRKGTEEVEDDEYLLAEQFLDNDAFDEDLTYGYRFAYDEEGEMKLTDLTDSSQIDLAKKILNTNNLEGKTVYDVNVTAWKNMYKDIVSEKTPIKTIETQNNGKYKVTYATSPETTETFDSLIDLRVNTMPNDWQQKFEKWFVPESAVYYSLFTTRYTMVDNRAKNSFWHFSKVYYTEAEAASIPNFSSKYSKYISNSKASADNNYGYRWDLCFDYDNDTSLGIDNAGLLRFEYGYDDQDKQDNTNTEVFRCSQSTFFCRLSKCYGDGKRAYGAAEKEDSSSFNAVYAATRNNIWNGNSLISDFDKWQDRWPERFWKMDIYKKYIYSYDDTRNFEGTEEAASSEFLATMANGRKKYQRRQFERNQYQYMGVKYRDHSVPSIFLRSDAGEKVSGTVWCSVEGKAYLGYGDSGSSKSYSILRYPQDWNADQHELISGKKYFTMRFVDTDMACVWGSNYITGCEGLGDVKAKQANLVNAPKIESLDLSAKDADAAILTSVSLKSGAPLKYLKLTNTPSVTTIGVSAQSNSGEAGPAARGLASLDRLETLVVGNSGLTDFKFTEAGKLTNFIVNQDDLSASTSSSVSMELSELNNLARLDYNKIDNLASLTIRNGSIMNELSNETEVVDKYDDNGKLVYVGEEIQKEVKNALPSIKEFLMHYFNQDRDWVLNNGEKRTKLETLTLEGINLSWENGEYLINRPPNTVVSPDFDESKPEDENNYRYLPQSDDYGLFDYLLKLNSEEGRINVKLAGKVYFEHLDTLSKRKYEEKWAPELNIDCKAENLRPVYEVTFKNWDGTVIEVRQVEGNSSCTNFPIATKESDKQYNYSFVKWDKLAEGTNSFIPQQDTVLTAEFVPVTRQYKIKWTNYDGTVLQESLVDYGQGANYEWEIPTRTKSELNYYLFSGWDKYPYCIEPEEDLELSTPEHKVYKDEIVIKAEYTFKRATPIEEANQLTDKFSLAAEGPEGIHANSLLAQEEGQEGLVYRLFNFGDTIDVELGWDPTNEAKAPTNRIPKFDLTGGRDSDQVIVQYSNNTSRKTKITGPVSVNFDSSLPKAIRYINTGVKLFEMSEFTIVLDYQFNDRILNRWNGGASYDTTDGQYLLSCTNGQGTNSLSILRNNSNSFAVRVDESSANGQVINNLATGLATKYLTGYEEDTGDKILENMPIKGGSWTDSSNYDRIVIRKKKDSSNIDVYCGLSHLTRLEKETVGNLCGSQIIAGPLGNGVKHFSIPFTYDVVQHGGELILGRNLTKEANTLCNCTIDTLKIWDSALTDVEVLKMANYPKETLTLQLSQMPGYLNYKTGNKQQWYSYQGQNGTVYPGVMLESTGYFRNRRKPEGDLPTDDTGKNHQAIHNRQGWANTGVCKWLNSRVYDALPQVWRSAIKNVSVAYITEKFQADGSPFDPWKGEIGRSNLNIFIPSIKEYYNAHPSLSGYNLDSEPYSLESIYRAYQLYNEDGTAGERIGDLSDNDERTKLYRFGDYYLNGFNRSRTAVVGTSGYFRVQDGGTPSAGTTHNYKACVDCAFCI